MNRFYRIPFRTFIGVFAVLSCSTRVCAAEPNSDPVGQHVFPPELLLQHRAELKLTDRQFDAIRHRIEDGRAELQKQQAKLSEAHQKLSQLLASENVDEAAALAQLDVILAMEKQSRRTQLTLMIQNRNELSVEQRKMAMKLKALPQVDLEARLKSKLASIEREVQKRATDGQPPQALMRRMQEFGHLMRNGQVVEAEAFLDRMLTSLNLGHTDEVNADPASAAERKQTREKRVAKEVPRLSRDAIAREIKSLKKEDVAWRKIAWKTSCWTD